jgi:outer membrane biosynthesis protein TonB
MVENRLYKIIALIVAIFTYLFFIFLFVKYVKEHEKIVKDYGFNVEEAIVVELDALEEKTPSKVKPQPKPKPIIKPIVQPEIKPQIVQEIKPEPIKEPEKPVEEEQQKEEEKPKVVAEEEAKKEQESRAKEAKSAKDLFSTIRSKKYEKILEERQKEDAARASRLAKQKAKREKEREAKRKKALAEAKALLNSISASAPSKHKKRGEAHDFWSPVSSKIMAKWNRTISTQDGLSASVKIRIDNNGILTYRILRLSNNPLFDKKLEVFLDNLKYETFPRYKDGSYIEATFEFKDKEQSF